ncbi:hypothetical protein NMG29_19275 [Streptomyces cocklensis]|uniref:ATP-binding protein n=1 Tax=Actinacidiphila cocklensis TaxID=887465 RepID=A0A9W4DUG3_9ACTN|nr:hypothetical protein [Actinacidiphila cocklensis]MDD1060314.1 hypothetical protein [Actinacidiphila cocklensis]CAG6394182.1 conserved hypothetical protein [Actinacidiphila cocklensis]
MAEYGGKAHNWRSIREWDGSQHRAFEELCFQLRVPAPQGWETIKTAAPDGGVEWYDQAPDGSAAHGYQVKFVHDIDDLLPQAKKSAKTVGENIAFRKIVRLEFLTPFDLSDPTPFTPRGRPREGARGKWNRNVDKWKTELPGLAGVDIRYVGGGELLERLTRPGNEGRQWFFFERRALGSEWFQDQMALAESLAESRYTPERHVELPLARVADACAFPEELSRRVVQRSRDLQAAVRTLVAGTTWWLDRYPAPFSSPAQEALAQWTPSWMRSLRESADNLVHDLCAASASPRLPAARAEAVTENIRDLLGQFDDLAGRFVRESSARGELPEPPSSDRGTREATASESAERLREGDLVRARDTCEQALNLLQSSAAQAAEKAAWLLLGEAGQGKTHLLVDAARRAVDKGRPALVLFGQELSGRNALSEIAQRRGLGQLPERDFLQAMDAAGAASGCRFLLIIDALNDSDNARSWKSELLGLQSRIARHPHIALVVSCRSTFSPLVLPDSFDGPTSVHPGFAGREVEGLESYLKGRSATYPNAPLLAQAFTNPLFVKLYADSLDRAPEQGSGNHPPDRSAVFDAFVNHRAKAICSQLGLDPLDRPVHRAVDALASRMAAENLLVLPRSTAREIADAFAPGATKWPATMLGELVTQGIVSNERTYRDKEEVGIGFPYQALGDDRVVRSVFAAHQGEIDALREGRGLVGDSPLRNWLCKAPPNYQETATTLLPEMTGTELIDVLISSPEAKGDAAPDNHPDTRHFLLARSFLETLPLRRAGSITDRSVALVKDIANRHGRTSEILEAFLSVTAVPGHRLNADELHRVLTARPRPERDAWWGVRTYAMLWDHTALHRLLRWAEQYPTPQHLQPSYRQVQHLPGTRPSPLGTAPGGTDSEVARLAGTTLVWTLTSSNRFLRDRATKALVQLLLGHTDVLRSLLTRFLHEDVKKVDDPYLFERLVWVAFGVLARRGDPQRDATLLSELAQQIIEYVYGDTNSPAHASRNALLCDAATRIVTMAHDAGAVTSEQAEVVQHPHFCPHPGRAPEEDDIDNRFPRRDEDGSLWGGIRASLSSLGDFADYRVRPYVNQFSMLPLTCDYPSRPSWQRRDDPVVVDPGRIPAFADSLPEEYRPVFGTQAAVTQLLTGWIAQRALDRDQYELLQSCQVPPALDERLADTKVDAKWAARWILARVAELGWTPELFSEFDTFRGRASGSRESHKGERIGKKYQWMALHELIERLANHHHPYRHSEHDPAEYPGGARLSLLDIDPSLPPARHPFDHDDETHDRNDTDNATFPPEDLCHPLAPPVPSLPDHEGVDEWIRKPDNLPDLEELAIRTDGTGRVWVVLNEYASDDHDGRGWSSTHGQAEQWHRIQSWLVPSSQRTALLTWLEGRSLTNRWMPEGPDRHSLLFADFPPTPGPWTDPDPDAWHVSTFLYPEENDVHGLDDTDEEQDLATPGTAAAPTAVTDFDSEDSTAARRRRWAEKQSDTLADLAERWADGPVEEKDDWLEATLAAQPHGRIDQATDSAGQPITAVPTAQTYSWSAQSSDCSLDASVSVTMLNDPLLRNSGLRRDPDLPHWYDADGRLQVQYLSWDRPTGAADGLLVSRDWLEQHLQRSDQCLIQGILGERQPVTTERPRSWREFSQITGHSAQGHRTPGTATTELRTSRW